MAGALPFPTNLPLTRTAQLVVLVEDTWRIEKQLSETEDVPRWTFYPAGMSEKDARRRAVLNADRAASGAGARYVIEESGRPLGTAGLVHRDNSIEVFFALLLEARGRGLATLAVNALCEWAFAHGHRSVELISALGNSASERVAQRAGFERGEVRQDDDGVKTRLWTHHAPVQTPQPSTKPEAVSDET